MPSRGTAANLILYLSEAKEDGSTGETPWALYNNHGCTSHHININITLLGWAFLEKKKEKTFAIGGT